MKKLLILVFLFSALKPTTAQVGIGTASPDASSKLDVSSTTKGFLPPRMTQAQRGAIASPATGLMVYQTDGTAGLYFYDGVFWLYVINAAGSTLPVSSGGTGATTLTSNALLTGSGTGAVGTISPGTSGKILFSNGTSWQTGSTTVGNSGSGNPFSILPPYTVVTFGIATQGTYPTFAGGDPYIGEIYMFAYSGNRVPNGYQVCNGASFAISSNSALYTLLGTTYGGNGTSTFNIPDLRGRFPMSSGQLDGSGSTFNVGDKAGASSVIIATGNMPTHTHTITYN